jgi:hypothetical protein
MKKSIVATLALALSSVLSTTPGKADSFQDSAPLYRNVNAASPGMEIIMPRSTRSGSDPLGNPLGYKKRFDVYPAGQSTRLYGSASRTFVFPNSCTNPQPYSRWSEDEKVVALPNSSRTEMAFTIQRGCTEQAGGALKRSYGIFIYSADLANGSGTVWTKAFTSVNDLYLDSFQGVDTNDDGVVDALMVVITYATNTGYGKRFLILNETTGAAISDSSYPN